MMRGAPLIDLAMSMLQEVVLEIPWLTVQLPSVLAGLLRLFL